MSDVFENSKEAGLKRGAAMFNEEGKSVSGAAGKCASCGGPRTETSMLTGDGTFKAALTCNHCGKSVWKAESEKRNSPQRKNAAPGEGFLGVVEPDEKETPNETPKLDNAEEGRKFDGKKLAEPRPCPKCDKPVVLVDTTTGLCKECFDKEPKQPKGDELDNSRDAGLRRGSSKYGTQRC
jgi:hypothetical protein